MTNQLVSASNGTLLSYDPLGRLWRVQASQGETRFEYDGDRLLEEFDGSGNLKRMYGWGPGTDEPLIVYDGPRHFLHADHQGSIVASADDNGNLQAINSYDEYGIPGQNNTGRFGYTGQAWLPELGMWYYKARMYSPTLGRFLQTDPVGYKDQMDLYAYVGNDPVNGSDPSGLAACGAHGAAPGGQAGDIVVEGHCDAPSNGADKLGIANHPSPPRPAPKPPIQTNSADPCDSGRIIDPARPDENAPSVEYYKRRGASVKAAGGINTVIGAAVYLATSAEFHHNGALDAQAYRNGSQSFANYAFGIFNASAGVPIDVALKEAVAYGSGKYKNSAQKLKLGIPEVNKVNKTSLR